MVGDQRYEPAIHTSESVFICLFTLRAGQSFNLPAFRLQKGRLDHESDSYHSAGFDDAGYYHRYIDRREMELGIRGELGVSSL